MTTRTETLAARIPFVLMLVLLAAAVSLAVAADAWAAPKSAVISFRVAAVGAPDNPSVAIVPFKNAIYRNCEEAPQTKAGCQQVGEVGYRYGIGELEVTVGQWVTFLNTADPSGRDPHRLYSSVESGSAWPRFGQIDFRTKARPGHHYSLVAPEWADKPYGFANFLRAARFVNSLYNGKVLAKKAVSEGGFRFVSYRVRLSPNTETGMYDMHKRAATRAHRRGFVIPSQNEWIKAAYYDPNGGGTYSYWNYPTNPGTPGDEATAPAATALDPSNGNVVNASGQPLANYRSETTVPSWCPSNQSAEACATVNPWGLGPQAYALAFQGSLSSVGQALTRSPWGTLDQGGNAVEWTDTITPPPFGVSGVRVWRRLHGGIANAPAYQLLLAAVGLQPQDNAFFTATYPWLGFRVGVVGLGR
jgi:hypothetical protein